MKAVQQNLNDWLRRKAHVITGRPFQMDDFHCVPVARENQLEEEVPVGFLVTYGNDVTYIAAQTPDGRRMITAWEEQNALEKTEQTEALPAEYWYG